MDLLLEIKSLRTSFFTYAGEVRAVDDVSFRLEKGETIGIVGESGCGKSVTALSVMRLLSDTGRIVSGSIVFDGEDMLTKSEDEMEQVRGNRISMVFQDPMTSLNPVLRIGLQMGEVLQLHQGMTSAQARARSAEMLTLVGIPNADRRLNQYPHQFSGGMRQRVMIGMALSCNPQLLIADEPTTAVDVTVQAQIMDLMRGLKARLGTSIILITHDLGIVAGMAARVVVMYAGKIIEEGPVKDIYGAPKHPYTWGLLGSIPRLNEKARRRLVPIHGQPPDLLEPPQGCRFNPRCAHALRICLSKEPPLETVDPDHQVACWRYHTQAPPLAFGPREGGLSRERSAG